MLSVEESARMLGVSGARVRKLIADGLLPATKVGRSWTIEEAAVMDRLATKPKGGRPPIQAVSAKDGSPVTDSTAEQLQIEKLKQLYAECKDAFKFRPGAACVEAAESAEEAAFYMAVADFFLKQEQAKLVKADIASMNR